MKGINQCAKKKKINFKLDIWGFFLYGCKHCIEKKISRKSYFLPNDFQLDGNEIITNTST